MTIIDAARQALDFVEFCWRDVPMNEYAFERCEATILTLRTAIEAAEKGEAVAQCAIYETSSGDHSVCRTCRETWPRGRERACERARALLARIGDTTHPQRQPLTDEQIDKIPFTGFDPQRDHSEAEALRRFARAVEREMLIKALADEEQEWERRMERGY